MATQSSLSSTSDLKTLEGEGIEFRGELPERASEVLTTEAVRFAADLARRYEPTRQQLLQRRVVRQQEIVDGRLPSFLPETATVRESDWKVAPIPKDLRDRRVEITGPVERKMIINALNSGAKVFMADFEDSLSPTWESVMDGQVNLRDWAAGTIGYTSPEGKAYTLNRHIATLIVRPRGWHLDEKHIRLNGK